MMAILVLYFAFSVPWEMASFGDIWGKETDSTFWQEVFVVIFAADIVLNFFTAYKVEQELVTDLKLIARRYVRVWFWIDLAATFPIGLLIDSEVSSDDSSSVNKSAAASGNVNKILRLMRVFKLMRIFRMARLLPRLEDAFRMHENFLRVAKLMLVLFSLWHWIACFYWFIAFLEDFNHDRLIYVREGGLNWAPPPFIWCEAVGYPEPSMCNSTAWIDYEEQTGINPYAGIELCFEEGMCPASVTKRYFRALYWAFQVTTGIGDDIRPVSPSQMWYSITCILAGVFMMCILIGAATRLVQNASAAVVTKRKNLRKVFRFLEDNEVPAGIQERILGCYEYTWSRQRNGKSGIVGDLHETLKLELDISMHKETMSNIPMFSSMNDNACLLQIILKLKSRILIPGEYVVLQGELGSEMYIIVEGFLRVIVLDQETEESEVVTTLHNGQVFGEISLILKQRRNASVRAATYCDVLSLSKRDFDSVMEKHPAMMRLMIRQANIRYSRGGWARLRDSLRMTRTCNMFGTTLETKDLLLPEIESSANKKEKTNRLGSTIYNFKKMAIKYNKGLEKN